MLILQYKAGQATPGFVGVVTYDTVGDPRYAHIHYLSIVNDATFGQVQGSETATYELGASGSFTEIEAATFDFGNDQLITSTQFGSTYSVKRFSRTTGTNVWSSTGCTSSTVRPYGIALNTSEDTFYTGEQNGGAGSGTVRSIAYPFALTGICSSLSATAADIETTIEGIDIDKTDENYVWVTQSSQRMRRIHLSTGVTDQDFTAGGGSGMHDMAHAWDGNIYTLYDASATVAARTETGTYITQRDTINADFTNQAIAGIFAWKPGVSQPY